MEVDIETASDSVLVAIVHNDILQASPSNVSTLAAHAVGDVFGCLLVFEGLIFKESSIHMKESISTTIP